MLKTRQHRNTHRSTTKKTKAIKQKKKTINKSKRNICHAARDELRAASSPSYNKVTVANSVLRSSLSHASKLLDQKVITSEDLVEAALEQIDATNPSTNAYLSVFKEQALADAEASDQRRADGKPLSPLDGIPISIKDNINVKDGLTTAGSQFLKTFKSPYNATVVQRLKDAGAIIIGKTNLDEFGMGSGGSNSSFGRSTSLFFTEHANKESLHFVPGGSSSGSAVSLQQYTAFGSIGTDTGGSVRLPAAYTGTVGFKPTYGATSRYGLVAYGSSLDCPGVMARSVRDVKMIFDIIQGADENDSTAIFTPKKMVNNNNNEDDEHGDNLQHFKLSNTQQEQQQEQPLKGLKVGIPQELMFNDIPDAITTTWANTADLFKNLGAEVFTISIPSLHNSLPVYYTLVQSEAVSNLARYDGLRYGQSHYKGEKNYESQYYYDQNDNTQVCQDDEINNNPNISALQKLYSTNRSLYFGKEVQGRLLSGNFVLSSQHYHGYVEKAMNIRQELTSEVLNTLYTTNLTQKQRLADSQQQKVDILLCPTSTILPPTFKQDEEKTHSNVLASYIDDAMTVFANLVGLPALALPMGTTEVNISDSNNNNNDSNSNTTTITLPIGMQLIGAPCNDYQLLNIGEVLQSHVKL